MKDKDKGAAAVKGTATVGGEMQNADLRLADAEAKLEKVFSHLDGSELENAATKDASGLGLVSLAERLNFRTERVDALVFKIAERLGVEL